MRSLWLLSVLICSQVAADSFSSAVDDDDLWEQLEDKAELSADLSYIQRIRKRKDESGLSDQYLDDLDHGTVQAAGHFRSGWLKQHFALNVSAFGASDLHYNELATRNIENEFSFAGQRWGEENNDSAHSGASLNRVAFKLRTANKLARLKLGYVPLQVPGIIGVNWSFQSGTYRGAQLKVEPKNWKFVYAWADKYKAPWYLHTQVFSRLNAWDERAVTSKNQIAYIHGAAASYQNSDSPWSAALAAGEAKDFMYTLHAKLAYSPTNWSVSYLVYASDSLEEDDQLYHSWAVQQGIRSSLSLSQWQLRAELMHTKAPGLGTYLPRLTRGYANSQGSNEFWWDSRSDWNNDGELAGFVGAWYQFKNTWVGGAWQWGVSGAYGFGTRRWVDGELDQNASKGSESAVNFDISYRVNGGSFEHAEIRLHFTSYHNHQDEQGSFYYANMFTSERDIKLLAHFPITLR
ncbi:hypothetical protein [Agarivorans sp. JK6]|uniref:hypothetical protein n=1 Tax=Agarivorans sp. JK6 TaxID=2997426 RepID=UPI0038733603